MYEIKDDGYGCYTVGSPSINKEGEHIWEPISDHPSSEEAQAHIHFLNGGVSKEQIEKIVEQKCDAMESRLKVHLEELFGQISPLV